VDRRGLTRRNSLTHRHILRHINKPSEPPGKLSRAPHRVRIIGGRYRRSVLPVADRPGLRPSPDRVRETLFNWLGHLRPDPDRTRGLDLFAGTGALGFELASRCTGPVLLIERDAGLARSLLEVRDRLGAGEVEVVRGDALEVGRRLPPASFDVIFLDPPFDSGLMQPALALARALLAPGGLVYAEGPAALAPQDLQDAQLVQIRYARAGRVHFHLLGLQQC
jgi:16S rRNA (guanine(966)-N(2))-methyltransferase RsmD